MLSSAKTSVMGERGTRVTIGKGCRIARVEYGELCHIHPKAEVGESVQS